MAVTAERLKQQAMTRGIQDAPIPDYTIEQWGIYEAERLSQMKAKEFTEFVLRAYGASRIGDDGDSPNIHGWRNRLPIWVGAPGLDSQATASDVQDFANAIRRTVEYRDANLRDGVMLAWGFSQDARQAADTLRQREHVDVNFVRLRGCFQSIEFVLTYMHDTKTIPQRPNRRTVGCSSSPTPSSQARGTTTYSGPAGGAQRLDSQATASDVQDFANAIRRTVEYRDANLRDGVMLAWGFSQDARQAADTLRQREHVDVNFVRLRQVRIGDSDFREHIVRRSTDRADYSEFLTFIQPPEVSVTYRALGGSSVTLDAGDSVVINSGAEVINVQWDLDHDGKRFVATPGYSFQKGRANDKRPQLQITHKFPRTGTFTIACRVQDSRGGEGMQVSTVEVR